MKVSNSLVAVVCAFASGCSFLPISHLERAKENPTENLFVSESGAEGIESSLQPAGLRVRKSERGNMESYVVRGQRYYTLDSSDGYSARGTASWYGPNFHGRTASNGEVYDMYRLTAAHKTLPLPTYARVTHIENGRSVLVKINDRGPFSGDRIIDLSFAAALRLGMVTDGTANVEVQALSPEELLVLSGPENKLGIDFYEVAEDGTEINAPESPDQIEVLAAAEPEAVEEVEDEVRVAAADTDAAPIVPEPIEAVTADSNELVAVAEDNAIDNSVLPALAEAAGQSVTAVPATVQAVAPPTNKDGTKKDSKGYFIQAGVFADVADAERLVGDVVLAAPTEEVHIKPLKGSELYRITVGPIDTSDRASEVSALLDTAGVDNFTVKVE